MRTLSTLLLLLAVTIPVRADKLELLGYGVRSCEHYLQTYVGWEKGDAKDIVEYYRYQDWLTGFVSGLSLATSDDQLRGVSVDGAMRRNRIHCQENLNDDFFKATITLLKDLKKIP